MQRADRSEEGSAVRRVLRHPFRQLYRGYRYVDGGYLRGHPELELFPTAEDRRKALDRVNRKIVWRRPLWTTVAIVALPSFLYLAVVPRILTAFGLPIRGEVAFLISCIPLLVGCPFVACWLLGRHVPKLLRHELLDCGVPICLACGYPLFGLPGPNCPECGKPFDEKVRGILDID